MKWRNIGLELNIAEEELDIINADNPSSIQKRCRAMLKVWLNINPKASWEKLFNAVKAAEEHNHNVDTFNDTADIKSSKFCYKIDTIIMGSYKTWNKNGTEPVRAHIDFKITRFPFLLILYNLL